jgi:tetratricopeptide (TPR) repeat protein/transcriptional regulator with XRE-family HTH domain
VSQDDAPEGLGSRLRRARLAAPMTLDELAQISGVSVRAISDLERGRTRKPYPETVRLLTAALRLPVSADGDVVPSAPLQERPQMAAIPRQLPSAAPCFTGRSAELAFLAWTLEQRAVGAVLISITGTAGVGKTALAVHWAQQVSDRFPDGQLYLNLRGFGPSMAMTADEAVQLLLDGLGVAPEHIPAEIDAKAALYRSVSAGRQLLIVLDNAADAAQVRPLLPGAPGCLVLVTSRNDLTGLAAADGARLLSLDVLTSEQSRQLLASRLGHERAVAESAAVFELTQLCARLPLALSIAAARAGTRQGQPLTQLAAELRDSRARLDALGTGDAATDLRSVFSWSCEQLSDTAGRMFRLLGLHPGPDITPEAAASLAALPPRRARQALAELSAANLITRPTASRYALHDLLSIYASEQAHLIEEGTAVKAARHRILDHYLHTASAASVLHASREPVALSGPQAGVLPEAVTSPAEALAWFRAERQVLISAIRLADHHGFGSHAWQLPWAVAGLLNGLGLWREMLETQQIALRAALSLGDLTGQAHARQFLGWAHMQLGDASQAVTELTAALELSRQLGSNALQARNHSALTHAFELLGRSHDALMHAKQSQRYSRAAGSRFGEAHSLNSIGWCHAQLGNYQQTLSYCRRALVLYRDLGSVRGEAATLDSLGYAHYHLGHHARAIACYQEAIEVLGETGDRDDQAEYRLHLGDAHLAAGDDTAARGAWQAGLAIVEDLQHPIAAELRSRLARRPARNGGPAGVTTPGTTEAAAALAGRIGHEPTDARR